MTRFVVDTSAVLAYTAGSLDVGEILAELRDENVRFAIPAVCLAEATAATKHPDMLDLLVGQPHAAVLAFPVDQWRRLGAGINRYGTLGRACAVVAWTSEHAEYVMSAEPEVYGGRVDTVQVW